jgi:hypothetical protein
MRKRLRQQHKSLCRLRNHRVRRIAAGRFAKTYFMKSTAAFAKDAPTHMLAVITMRMTRMKAADLRSFLRPEIF